MPWGTFTDARYPRPRRTFARSTVFLAQSFDLHFASPGRRSRSAAAGGRATMSLYTERAEHPAEVADEDIGTSTSVPDGAAPAEAENDVTTDVETVGTRLARGRAARALEIEELSRRTYIRPGVLRRMEENDFEACGGACYARGQLRILAVPLQLDADELVALFDQDVAEWDSAIEPDDTWQSTPRRGSRTI